MKTADLVAQRRFPIPDRPFLRELQRQTPLPSLGKIFRKALQRRAGQEHKALVYFHSLPAPSKLDTEDPFVDDELLAAVIRIRARKPRWEAAWHLRGDFRIAPKFPLVFVNNRFVPGSASFYEYEDGVTSESAVAQNIQGPLRTKTILRCPTASSAVHDRPSFALRVSKRHVVHIRPYDPVALEARA